MVDIEKRGAEMRRNKFVKFIVINLLIIMAISIFDYRVMAISIEDKNMSFERITIEDGLSQASIYSLFQDSKGYMWIGTADGLNRYNGKKIEIYRKREDLESSIIGSYISTINEDNNDNLWVGTTKGLNRIDLKTNKIYNYVPKENGCNLSHSNITEILVDSKGDIYISTVDGVNKYNPEKDNFERVFYSGNLEESLTSQFVYTMSKDEYGNMWVGTAEGLNKIDEDGVITKFYHYENDMNSISSDIIYKLYSDGKGYIWIGTDGGGLNKMNILTGEITRYTSKEDDPTSISGEVINSIIQDEFGELWIGTNKGLSKHDSKTDTFITYKSKIYDNKSLINDDVLSLYQDASGMIWVGTYTGISMFNPENTFVNYRYDPFDKNSISSNSMAGIYEDDDGLLWVGTTHSGINIIDRKNSNVNRITTEGKEGESLSDNRISDIVGFKNEIWIATSNGLNKYDKDTKKITVYHNDGYNNSLVNDNVKNLHIDEEGLLWITTRSGICTFDRKDTFKDYTNIFEETGLSEVYFSDVYEDSDGLMWFASALNDGLIKYNKETEEVKVYKNNPNDENSISSNSVKSIQEDSLGCLWIATNYGLNKFDKEKEVFERYKEVDGLANNFVYGVLTDSDDNIWASTNYGISKFDVKANKFINFDVTDGIQGNEFNGYSFFKSKSGEMFFGGINGLTMFNPSEIKDEGFAPEVKVEKIYSEGNSIQVNSSIELGFQNNQFEVEFFMPDYRNTSKIQYSYKLEGFDEEWIFANDRNYANYTNLEPGNYEFNFMARNSRGDWSDVEKIHIKVNNPPWKTPQAYMGYIVAIAGIVYLIWNRVKLLDNLVKQRTQELNNNLIEKGQLYNQLIRNEKYKNNYFVNLSHELRTPLNVIISTQQLIKTLNRQTENISKDKLNHYMDTLRRNSDRLLKLINNIIDTSKIESGSYKLDVSKVDIVYLIEEAVLSMKDYIERNGIELIIDPEIEEKLIECDENEIEKCIINLVANAVKFTPEGGKIEVKIEDFNEYLVISVKDTGVGIDPKYHDAIFNRFGQAYNEISEEHGGSGLGLTLTNQLVKLHGGEIKLESEVGKGSTFSIILPY